MLKKLIIRNFVLIDALEIDFYPSFSVITGETGAGKSIILCAIGLLMGQRSDSSLIRPGAERCIIEAHFDAMDETVGRILSEEDIDFDPNECIIRREISVKGKSRSFVNDTPASLALLKRLSEYLIDVHSQHKNLLLGDAQFQLSVLDLYSQNQAELKAYQRYYLGYKSYSKALAEARIAANELIKEQDYLQFQYNQLEAAQLQPDELQGLEEEEQRLTHALDIKTGLSRAYSALDDDDRGAVQAIAIALDGVQPIRKYYPEAEELHERLTSAKLELSDLMHTLDANMESIEYDPQRLSAITERLDLLNGLLLKHGVGSTNDLIDIKERIAAELEAINTSDDRIAQLEQALAESHRQALESAELLHASREQAAREVEQALIAGLLELGMPYVRLNILVERGETLTSTGLDQVTFLFSANKEIKPEPVAHIASGGEISRLMLCIKALIADRRSLPTIIFDEIDTGVSGDIADRIGAILQSMGRSMQVMAVTHLPQIAASGAQ
ncbi:MAG: DNA repair protein RecN, partial [Porphyromonadaceae bacterium]|nr:DNA repair protein RecN [Porphyromonadaceae bacterium]